MIDYEVICQTIEDWRAGRRPSIDLSAAPAAGYEQPQYAEGYEEAQPAEGYEQAQYAEGYEEAQPAEGYEQAQYAEGYEQPAEGYEEAQPAEGYEQAQYAEGYEEAQPAEGYEQSAEQYQQVPEAGYEQVEYEDYDGAPELVESGSTSPVNVADVADEDDELPPL